MGSKEAEITKVLVDYDMSLTEMIAAGRYFWRIYEINATNFPVSGESQKEVKLKLIHLNRVASTEEILEEMDRRGLQPAKIEELLGLGAKYPELQKQFPIIALGSVWRHPNGYLYAPCLNWLDRARFLGLHCYDNLWEEYCRFLAVPKAA